MRVSHSVVSLSLILLASWDKSQLMICLLEEMWMRLSVFSRHSNSLTNMERFVQLDGNQARPPWSQIQSRARLTSNKLTETNPTPKSYSRLLLLFICHHI